MIPQIPLDSLTVAEKLVLMERLWEDLSRRPDDVPSPEWHAISSRGELPPCGKAERILWIGITRSDVCGNAWNEIPDPSETEHDLAEGADFYEAQLHGLGDTSKRFRDGAKGPMSTSDALCLA